MSSAEGKKSFERILGLISTDFNKVSYNFFYKLNKVSTPPSSWDKFLNTFFIPFVLFFLPKN